MASQDHRLDANAFGEKQGLRTAMFADAGFAGDLQDSKSTSGGLIAILGKHTFVPLIWMCKKQTAVSHSSTEAEVIALDAALRMEGIPCVQFWSVILDIFGKDVQEAKSMPSSNSRPSFWDRISSAP